MGNHPDKEVILAAEESTRKNLLAMRDHCNETRRLVNDANAKIEVIQNQMLQLTQRLNQLVTNFNILQSKFYEISYRENGE